MNIIIRYMIMILGLLMIIISVISLLRFIFGIKPLFKMNFSNGYIKFRINKSGDYSIWAISNVLFWSPIKEYMPVLINLHNHQQIDLIYTLMGLNIKAVKSGKRQLFNFYAEEGEYILYLSKICSYNNGNIYLNSTKDIRTLKYNLEITEKPSVEKFLLITISLIFSSLILAFSFI